MGVCPPGHSIAQLACLLQFHQGPSVCLVISCTDWAQQVCLPWVANPLRVEYVDDAEKTLHGGKRFAYGTTSLHGHLLAGEERFALDWNPVTNNVT